MATLRQPLSSYVIIPCDRFSWHPMPSLKGLLYEHANSFYTWLKPDTNINKTLARFTFKILYQVTESVAVSGFKHQEKKIGTDPRLAIKVERIDIVFFIPVIVITHPKIERWHPGEETTQVKYLVGSSKNIDPTCKWKV